MKVWLWVIFVIGVLAMGSIPEIIEKVTKFVNKRFFNKDKK